MKKRINSNVLWLVVAFIFAGLGVFVYIYSLQATTVITGGVVGATCASDTDCGAGEVCKKGQCILAKVQSAGRSVLVGDKNGDGKVDWVDLSGYLQEGYLTQLAQQQGLAGLNDFLWEMYSNWVKPQ